MRTARLLLLLLPALLLAVTGAADHGQRALTIIAHRGASWDAPENTFAAWDLALERGAHWIEQDVRRTADGVLVVFHDDSLHRTARGPADACTGVVHERRLAELRRCEVGSWFNTEYPDRARAVYVGAAIPTLDAVLARYVGRARFYIELKGGGDAPAMERETLALLRRHGLVGRDAAAAQVIIQSFDADALRRIHALEPSIPLTQLLGDDPVPAAELAARLTAIAGYARGVGPSRRIVSARFVEAAHAAGLVVHAYTVNAPETMAWMRSIGVDGLFTDRPDELARLSP